MSWMLPRLVGVTRAADLLLSGRAVTGAETDGWGLWNDVLPDGEAALAAAHEHAAAARRPRSAPQSIRMTKRQLYDDLLTHDVGASLDRGPPAARRGDVDGRVPRGRRRPPGATTTALLTAVGSLAMGTDAGDSTRSATADAVRPRPDRRPRVRSAPGAIHLAAAGQPRRAPGRRPDLRRPRRRAARRRARPRPQRTDAPPPSSSCWSASPRSAAGSSRERRASPGSTDSGIRVAAVRRHRVRRARRHRHRPRRGRGDTAAADPRRASGSPSPGPSSPSSASPPCSTGTTHVHSHGPRARRRRTTTAQTTRPLPTAPRHATDEGGTAAHTHDEAQRRTPSTITRAPCPPSTTTSRPIRRPGRERGTRRRRSTSPACQA